MYNINMQKYIFHIDIDCFFVSAQRTINSSLINKPVVISKNNSHSIAVAVSYEARALGAKVGSPLFMMQNIIKDLIVVSPQYELYTYLSTFFFEYLANQWSNKMEVLSVDECYLDVTDLVKNNDAIIIAKQIQKTVMEKYKLPVTIGIAPNKFLAKMATNFGKPFGVFELNHKNFKEILYPLDIKKFYFIGKSSVTKLKALNINTIGDFAALSPQDPTMQKIFGKRFIELWQNAQGEGETKLNLEHNDLKQIGNSLTFEKIKLDQRDEILLILEQLCLKVANRMENRNTVAQQLSIQIKVGLKAWKSKQIQLPKPIKEFQDIYKLATKLFDNFWSEEPIKGIGISCGKLIDEFKEGMQINLFEDDSKTTSKVEKLIQKVNYQLQKKEIYSLADLQKNIKKKQTQSRFLEEDYILKK